MPRSSLPSSRLLLPVLFVIFISLSACGLFGPSATPTPTLPTVTPTPVGPQTLNICTDKEPSSLYLYGDNSEAASAIRQAIYDGPFDLNGYVPQAVILESVPALDTGGAVLQSVTVSTGATIVDVDGVVRPLQTGVRVLPSGCKDGNCAIEYTGGDIQMDQLVVTFTLKSGLLWSDGTPLTAADSVYSYELNAHSDTPGDKTRIDRTASYAATDERTVVWTGLPGYRDPGYRTNFWTPLPRHAWEATAAADLLTADLSARSPLGWGPFVINEWVAGERISLSRNANYFRAAEGLPKFSGVNFLFTNELQEIDTGTCDVVMFSSDESNRMTELRSASPAQYQVHFGEIKGTVELFFGIYSQSYDDGFNVFTDRADYFGNVSMRHAIASCVDQQSIWEEQTTRPWQEGPPIYPYSPDYANETLDSLGWVTGANGIRVNQFFPGALAGVPLQLNLFTSDDPQYLAAADLIKQNLMGCGVDVVINAQPAEQVFSTGPLAPIFGRNFDLALFAWARNNQSLQTCHLLLSEAIPGEDLDIFKYGWGGWNITGWQNGDFDQRCKANMLHLPGEQVDEEAIRWGDLYTSEIPFYPLYHIETVYAFRPDFCGYSQDLFADPLTDLEMFGYAEWCQ